VEGFSFWLMVSEALVHHGGEGMVEQSSSQHGIQEASESLKVQAFPF
jgi:hypothetical protein